MNDTVTILGRVGGDPNRSETAGGVPVVNFRVASTQRRYDSKTQTWIDTNTNWYNVSAFRQLAENAKVSLRSGDGVIVTGRLKLREWESGGKKGMSADIEAETIGHDLRWGTAAYAKTRTASAAAPASDHSRSHDPNSDAPDEDFGGESAVHDATADADDEAGLAFAGASWSTPD